MPEHDQHAASRRSQRLAEVLAQCAERGASAPVTAMRLLMEADSPELAHDALRRSARHGALTAHHLERVADLIARHPTGWATVRAVARAARHEPAPRGAAHWSTIFDRLVHISPEASVALYSLGSPNLLARATEEIVALLCEWGLLSPAPTVLDIGCGIGRLEAALAPCARAITGLDVSPAMIAEARKRHGALENVRFEVSDGVRLTGIDEGSVDLVTLVDTFPYLFLSEGDLPERQVLEAARVLRSGGSLLVFNVSYRGDLQADRADLTRFADAAGLHLLRWEPSPFSIWDAPAAQLTKL